MYNQFKENQGSDSKSSSKPEYIYFNGRGRGEGVRFLFAEAGMEYIDHRVDLGGQEWKDMKPNTPFGFLPVLMIDGESLPESVAIGSYVAQRGGLAGANPVDQSKIFSLVLKSNEFREDLAKVMFLKVGEEEKAKEMEKFLTGKAKETMGILNKALAEKKFLHGDKLSFADIWFYHCLELLILGCKKTDFLDQWPKLKELYKRVGDSPKIAEYIKNRPETAF